MSHDLSENAFRFARYLAYEYSDYPGCFYPSLDFIGYEQGGGAPFHFAQVDLFRAMQWSTVNDRLLTVVWIDLTLLHNLPPYLQRIKDHTPLDPLTRSGTATAADVEQIRRHFPVFVDVFLEKGLQRLRTCSPLILRPLRNNQWLDESELSSYCPVSSWSTR